MPDFKSIGRWRFVVPALRIVAEAGWLTVLYAAAATLVDHQSPVLGPIEFGILVLAGMLLASFSQGSPRLGALILIDAVVVAGVLGWLADGDASQLAFADLGRSLGHHHAGWLAGLAVMRGAIVRTGESGEAQIEAMLRSALPGVAILWAVTTVLGRPALLLAFAISAMWGSVLLIAAALMSIGLTRLDMFQAAVSDQPTRRGWRWLVTLIAVLVGPVAAPFVILSGIPLKQVLGPFVGPMQAMLGLLLILLQLMGAVMIFILQSIVGPLGISIDEPPLLDELQQYINNQPLTDSTPSSAVGTVIGVALIVITVVVVCLAIYGFARWLLMRTQHDLDVTLLPSAEIERTTERPERIAKPPSTRNWLVRHGPPHEAVGAYVAALGELDHHPDYARGAAETPAGHAARMQIGAMPGRADLARLAADYQVARYAERPINQPENRRAVARFERLRRLLRSS